MKNYKEWHKSYCFKLEPLLISQPLAQQDLLYLEYVAVLILYLCYPRYAQLIDSINVAAWKRSLLAI